MGTNNITLNKLLTITDEKFVAHLHENIINMLQAMIKTYYKITKAISKTIYNMLIQTTSDIKNIYELVYINSKIYCIYLHKKHSSNIMILKKWFYGENEKPKLKISRR